MVSTHLNGAAIARARKTGDAEAERDARRELAAAKIENYVRSVVDQAPPLTAEQRDRLALLLRGGAADDTAA